MDCLSLFIGNTVTNTLFIFSVTAFCNCVPVNVLLLKYKCATDQELAPAIHFVFSAESVDVVLLSGSDV